LEEGRHEQYGEELEAVVAALDQSKEAGYFLRNPGYTTVQRHNAVDALASALKLSPVVVNFLRLLVDRQRIADLAQIARAYRVLVDEKVGRVRATVTAQPRSPTRRRAPARGHRRHDRPHHRAGFEDRPFDHRRVVTQVGATMFDGSLRTQLERMREQLKARRYDSPCRGATRTWSSQWKSALTRSAASFASRSRATASTSR